MVIRKFFKIKKEAKKLIKGNVLLLFISYFMVIFFKAFCLYLFKGLIGDFLVIIFTLPLDVGLAKVYLDYVEKRDVYLINIFTPYMFGYKKFLSVLFTSIVKYFLITVYSTLLFIPGLIKRYSYSQVNFIRQDEDFKDYNFYKCLKLSKKMMRFHKQELFYLDISLIGWYFLIPITAGLILIYTIPYIKIIKVNFYYYVKEKYIANNNDYKSIFNYFIKSLIK